MSHPLVQLSAFVKYIVYDFNKRESRSPIYQVSMAHSFTGWYEEQQPNCKTPTVSLS